MPDKGPKTALGRAHCLTRLTRSAAPVRPPYAAVFLSVAAINVRVLSREGRG
jgi:hypothetical protein